MVLNGNDIIEFEPITDTTKNIIKVVGVGGGGCNAVGNMYREGMESVTFAVCNTDSKSLSINPVPTKIMLGKEGTSKVWFERKKTITLPRELVSFPQ